MYCTYCKQTLFKLYTVQYLAVLYKVFPSNLYHPISTYYGSNSGNGGLIRLKWQRRLMKKPTLIKNNCKKSYQTKMHCRDEAAETQDVLLNESDHERCAMNPLSLISIQRLSAPTDVVASYRKGGSDGRIQKSSNSPR
jgi:hypothetical protein